MIFKLMVQTVIIAQAIDVFERQSIQRIHLLKGIDYVRFTSNLERTDKHRKIPQI